MCPRSGTRRSRVVHVAHHQLCRVPTVRTHGKAWIFTVCPRCRHTANRRRRRQLARTASSRFFSPCVYIYTRRKDSPCARLLTHGKQELRRPCSCRRRFAVGHRRRSLRRVLTVLRRVPRAHGELVVSGSEGHVLQSSYSIYTFAPILASRFMIFLF